MLKLSRSEDRAVLKFEGLSEADMGVFNRLREWRSKRCRQEGVPPYIIFTNKQLDSAARFGCS
jgi:superfamily II DNA helicase RecQ